MELTHIDTCLSCYLQDHHNHDGELLLGVLVDSAITFGEVLAELKSELQQTNQGDGFDYDAAAAAIAAEFADVDLTEAFDASLESPDEFSDDGDYPQAWFLLTWEV